MKKRLIASGPDLWKCSALMKNIPPLDSKPTDSRESSQYVHCQMFFLHCLQTMNLEVACLLCSTAFLQTSVVLTQILKRRHFSFFSFFHLFLSINVARISLKRSSILYEPVHGKTNILGSDQVRHKQACTVTEDGRWLETGNFGFRK